MLRISKALRAGRAQDYHKLEYTSPTQSSYQQGDAVKGEWQGKLAGSFGLSGEVSALEFARLTEGRNPLTDEQMIQYRKRMEYKNRDGSITRSVEHRAGWDAIFSAPKSISLTAVVGRDEHIREAHSIAVTIALNELEKYARAKTGNNPDETTGKFIVAKFEHDTARPVDGYAAPHLHTHVVIFNVTERADGSRRALREHLIFTTQQYATAIYRSELTYRLRTFGYEIEAGRNWAPEIKGYTQEYLDASSLRSQRIRDAMEKSGFSGREASVIAGLSTREKKHTLTPAQVLAAHEKVAAEYGNQPQQVVAEARERARTQQHNPDRNVRAKEAMTHARDSLFERLAVADERLILRDALQRGMGETTCAEVRADFNMRRERGDFRSVEAARYASRSFTTPDTIAAEHANVAYVLAGRNAVTPILSAEQAQEEAKSRDYFNDSQRRAVEEVLNSTDRIHGLQGWAGLGKTRTLAVIREGAAKGGYTVEGFSPTSRAVAQLREAGIDATMLRSFLTRGEETGEPVTKHLYMLDESSLASPQQMRSFLSRLRHDDRVLVIGDTHQHQDVDAGHPFQQMQDAVRHTAQLDRIMRQRDPELLQAVQHLANNATEKGVALLAQQGSDMGSAPSLTVSHASEDARIYTNNAETLGKRLATDVSKISAMDFRPSRSTTEVRQAVAAFRANDPATGTRLLQRQRRVHEYASSENRLAAVALDYTSKADRAVVIAPDPVERQELKRLIRSELQAQGRLSSDSRQVSILVEQRFGNPRLVANYAQGDEIRYRVGSPREHGIAHNGAARVLAVDIGANALTVRTRDGNEVSYNPALLKKQTGLSTVYREEQRDVAVGELIRFIAAYEERHIRTGDFATVDRVGEDNALSVRLDNGRSVELDSDKARYIEYGYAVETAQRASAGRVLVTGDASQLARQQEIFTRLSTQTRDLAFYTSERRGLAAEKTIPGTNVGLPQNEIPSVPDSIATPPAPTIELESLGIGL
jgi:conjugative relaxase-like TrwC/TraI family protein